MIGALGETVKVGHDRGRLVLRLEQRLDLAPALVCRAIASLSRRPARSLHDFLDADGVERRWEVERLGDGAFVDLVAFIPAEDLDLAARIGAAHHLRFAALIRALDSSRGRKPCLPSRGELTSGYSARFAAALADTD